MIRKVLLALFVAATPLGSQTPELDFHFSGEELSSAIKKAWNAPLPPVIAVVDGCREDSPVASGGGKPSVLGQKVSEAIRAALREAPQPLAQVDYAVMQQSLQTHGISPADLCNHRMASWFALDLGANLVLLPGLRRSGDHLMVQTHVIRTSDQKGLLRFSHRAPATPEALSLLDLVPDQPKPRLEEELPKAYRPARDGVTVPSCIKCPSPSFTKTAVAAKFQGAVVLRLIISAEGRAERVSVVRGAPFALSQAAIETVKEWRFKPATNAQGKPVPVWTVIEVNFRQY